jgi:TonB-dependent starch-binding outer membrane protein SusC
MKAINSIFFKFLLLCLMINVGYYASAQENTSKKTMISGKIIDENGTSMPGINIAIEGTAFGNISDINGNYTINVPEGKEYLIFSFVGYQTQRINIKGLSTLNVKLIPDVVGLSEIVVVGYGVQKKSLVTGSISKVTSDEISETHNLRVEQALQGKISGVTIQANSGQPGKNLNVLIRGIGSNGSTEPLYVIDGMKVGVDGMTDLNPDDIESVEIMKDAASAAIYGTQAANGVMLITTKKGKKGGTGVVTYSGNWGISDASIIPKVMNANEYATYMRNAYTLEKVGNTSLSFNDPSVKAFVDTRFPYNPDTIGKGTDWIAAVVNKAPQQNHVLSFSSGTEKSSTYISGSYFNQNGIIGGDRSKFERYTFSANNSTKVNEWITVQGKLDYSNKLQKAITENDVFTGIMSLATNMDPITPIFFPDASSLNKPEKANSNILVTDEDDRYYAISRLASTDIVNPLAYMATLNRSTQQSTVRGRLSADFEIFKNLIYSPSISFEDFNDYSSQWRPAYYLNTTQTLLESEVSKNTDRGLRYIWEEILRYDYSFGDHAISFLAGNSYEKYKGTGMNAMRKNLLYNNDNFAYFNTATQTTGLLPPGDYIYEDVMISYFGRITYNWKEKVLLTFNNRADGSMKFGTNNRFGYFPSISLGYVPTKESWWQVPVINSLKLRGSWGQNGSNANLGSYDYVSTIVFGSAAGRYPDASGTILSGARPGRIANPALKWETSQQIDFGIDMGLFSNKVFITADYYIKDQKDFLAEATVPIYVGNPNPIINAGTIRNSGFELDLKYVNYDGELKYSINFSTSYLHNEVLNMPDNVVPYQGVSLGSGASAGIVNKFEVGQPVWYFWGYKTNGFFKNAQDVLDYKNDKGVQYQSNAIPGDVKFVDLSGDGTIDESDKTYLGKPLPTMSYGLSLNLSYKIFDFSAALSAVTGNSVYNATIRPGQGRNNRLEKYFENSWLPENTDASWFRPTITDNNRNFRESDLFVEDASYIKLRNVQVGITIPSKITRIVRIEKLRIYVSGSNLLTFTKYTGGDPEIGRTPGIQNGSAEQWNSIGIDRGFYPVARTCTFGINVTF